MATACTIAMLASRIGIRDGLAERRQGPEHCLKSLEVWFIWDHLRSVTPFRYDLDSTRIFLQLSTFLSGLVL